MPLARAACSALLAACAVAAGCGGPAGGTDAGAGMDGGGAEDAGARLDAPAAADAPVAEDARAAADAPVTADATAQDSGPPPAACEYVRTIDRSCAGDADCLVRIHQVDCCGTTVAIGIHEGAAATYATSEAACMASYPACGCAARAPTTDSGETFFDTAAVQVACVAEGPTNVCRTYVTMRPAGTP